MDDSKNETMAEPLEMAEYNELVNAAVEAHIKPSDMRFGQWVSFILDTDVKLEVFGVMVHQGAYFLDVSDGEKPDQPIHVIKMDPDNSFLEFSNGTSVVMGSDYDDGLKGSETSMRITASFPALEIRGSMFAGGRRNISFMELAIWLAVLDARKDGDDNLARRIISTAYKSARKKSLPKQDTKKPTSYTQGISKLTQEIVKVPNDTPVMFNMSGPKEVNRVLTPVRLTYGGDDGIEVKNLDPYDIAVHYAFGNLWNVGNRFVTLGQVHKLMSGGKNPSQSATDKLKKSIERQWLTFSEIDYSKEFRGRSATFDGQEITPEKTHVRRTLLSLEEVVFTDAKGREVTGYRILTPPVLFEHDMMTGQVISYPVRLLTEISKKVSSTDRNMLIRDYLIRRIKAMNHRGSRLSNKITYKAVSELLGDTGKSRTQAQRTRESVAQILDVMVEQGFITGWKQYGPSDSRKTGVEITVR